MTCVVVCAVCNCLNGWHSVTCPVQRIPTLGMGTVSLDAPLAREDEDDVSDCAAEGMGALTQGRERAA